MADMQEDEEQQYEEPPAESSGQQPSNKQDESNESAENKEPGSRSTPGTTTPDNAQSNSTRNDFHARGTSSGNYESKPRKSQQDKTSEDAGLPVHQQRRNQRVALESTQVSLEEVWNKFSASEDPIRSKNVPWLPAGTLSPLSLNCKYAPIEKQIRIVRAAQLFWHPDKWQQKFGGRLRDGGEAERILERVTETARHVNALRQSLKG